MTVFIKGLIIALLLILFYFITHSLLTGNIHQPANENNSIAGDTAKNIILRDSVAQDPQERGANSPQERVTQNTVVVPPNEIKKTVTRKDSTVETGIIIKDDNAYPAESVKDSAAVRINVTPSSAEEKVIKENSPVHADANKNIKKKKGFFRKVKDFIEEHINDLDDANIIIEKGKRNPPAKSPVKTSPVKHPPVIEPVKKPDNNSKTTDPNLN